MYTSFNPIHIIQGEIYGLLSHLKLNTRWASSQSLLPENTILKSLKNLSNVLHNESNFENLDTCTYLDPFLLVIRSAETSGPITGTALTSVNKFLTLFIDSESNGAMRAIRSIAESVTHCKFEATDSKSDEVVLMKILQVLSSCIKNRAGIYLTNELVFESMNTCFLMTDQSRSSELLKKTAEITLQEIVTTTFTRYNVYHSPPTPPTPPPPPTNSNPTSVLETQNDDSSNNENNIVGNGNVEITTTTTIVTTTTTTISSNENNSNSENNTQHSSGTNEIDSIISSFTDEPSAISSLQLGGGNQFSPNNDLFFSNLPNSSESLGKPNESLQNQYQQQQQQQQPQLPPTSPQTQQRQNGSINSSSSSTTNTPVTTPVTKPIQHHHSLPSNTLSPPHTHHINHHNYSVHSSSNSSNNSNINNSSGINNSTYITVVNPKLNDNNQTLSDKSYDETVLIKMMKFFVSNITPSHMDNEITRLLSMNVINLIIQMRGSSLESSTGIMSIIQDELFKYLLLNLCKNIPTFSLSMRIFFNLFVSLRHCLKAQFEEFFNVLLKSIVDNRQLFELQELALEGLRDFCKFPLAMVELFINYDCELYSSNIFESLCKTLYKNSFPLSGPLNTLHMLSLENLLSIIQSIDDRSKYPRYISHSQLPASDSLEFIKKKNHKRIMGIAATHFNRKPADAFNYLVENKIYQAMDAKNISKFFLETPKLNLKTVGEYIGKKANKEILSHYLDYFMEKYDDYILVFRAFLESFIIPGESAIIEHIFEMLASKIYPNLISQGRHIFADQDSLFLFLYSGLMLHTSTFNKNIAQKDKMNYHSFERMLRPCNISDDLIRIMFTEMTVELCAEDETAVPGIVSHSTWRNTLKKSKKMSKYVTIDSNEYDREIFPIILNVVIPSISNVFEKIENDSLSKRVLDGFHLCAQVSANNNINESIDTLMNSLCSNTTLIEKEGVIANQTPFIGDNKAQLATITTFEIAMKYSGHLSESWKNLILVICKMNKLGLLSNVFDVIDFPVENNTRPERNTDQQNQPKSSSSLLRFWFSADDEEIEVENKDEEKAKICVENCHIKDLFLESKNLPISSLENLLQVLYQITTPKTSGFNQNQATFCLDLLTHVVLLNVDRLSLIWSGFATHIEHIIQACEGTTMLSAYVEKTVISLMYLLIRLVHVPEVSQSLESLVALILRTFKANPFIDSIAEKMSVALVQLVQEQINFLSTNQNSWVPIIGIIVLLAGNPRASSRACDVLALLIQQPKLTIDTCKQCLTSVNFFIESKTIPSSVTIKAMELLYFIFIRISDLSQISNISISSESTIAERVNKRRMDQKILEAWEKYWSPILQTLSKLCVDPKPNIRNNAMSYLQKCILSSSLDVLSPQKWFSCFVDIVFPLLNSLKENAREANYEDTRLRASALLSKVFLQNLTIIIQLSDFMKLWTEILSYLRTYMGLSEVLSESVPESLKNMLLVMNNSGVFKAPDPSHSEESIKLWELTWSHINEFCPKIREDVLSRVDPNHNQPQVASTPQQQQTNTTSPQPTSQITTPISIPINNNNNNITPLQSPSVDNVNMNIGLNSSGGIPNSPSNNIINNLTPLSSPKQ